MIQQITETACCLLAARGFDMSLIDRSLAARLREKQGGLEELKEGLEVGVGLNHIYLMLIGLPSLIEGLHVLLLQWLCWWRIHLQRIDRRAVFPYAEVEMRTC